MGLFEKVIGVKSEKEKMEELYGMFDQASKRFLKEFTDLLSDPDIEVRKDCSEYIIDIVIPILKAQKPSHERDDTIEIMTLLSKEMRAPADDSEELAMKSCAFYFTMDMIKNKQNK